MTEKEKSLSKEERTKMYEELQSISSPEEARAFHKKYKAYGYGLSFIDRYPNSRIWFLMPALAMSIAALVISCMKL